MAVVVRQATGRDVPLQAQTNDRLVADQGSLNPFSMAELEQRFAEWLQTGTWQVDVFFEREQVIGYAVYQQRGDYYYPDQKVVYVRQFYIEREYRGQGLGRAAFHALSHHRFPEGCPVALDVVATNPAGQQFWSRLGFSPYFMAMKWQGSE